MRSSSLGIFAQRIRRFIADDRGFIAAEKALITLLALGAVIVVAKYILAGSTKASDTIKTKLESTH